MNPNPVSLAMDDGVAVITVNSPPVNTITAAVRQGLFAAVADIRARPGVAAVVLVCEGSTFFSGADIGEFAGPPKEAEFRDLFRQLEQLPVPVVAGMHGVALGGGLEIALACHYRVALPSARFGFPEVTLGIIPGAGGTQRMPRLIGVERTLEMILAGRPVDVATAIAQGFIDAEVQGDLRAATIAYARALVRGGGGVRRTSDRGVDPATATPAIIERLKAQAKSQYPNREAALTAIQAVSAAASMPFEAGLVYETELANRSKATPEAKALIHVFFAERDTRKVPGLPQDTKGRNILSAGVIGAGTMGGGIAICFANAGLPVTVIDGSQEALDRGLTVVGKTYDTMVKRGRLTVEEKEKRLALIRGSLNYADLAGADVVIEAVYESLDLKRKIFGAVDKAAKPGAVLATNTSTLDIAEIAAATRRPEDVVGLHFFAPANVMPLLEVVRTDATAPAVIRTALDLAKSLRKTPVLARVCYGFIGNRMMEGYAREAQRMVLEGATPRQVDGALEAWGMAMGILAVFDMAGVDVGVNVHRANADRYPPDPAYYQADFALHAAGRLGQKSGKGYYKYLPGDRARHDDPEAVEILKATARRLDIPQRAHSADEIVERCLYPLINEGMRILEEGVALRASDVDVVWCAGYGFPRYRGGPMFYADSIGLKTVLDGMLKYRDQFGPMHWQPAPLLTRLVSEGRTLAQWDAARLSLGEKS
ncbi:MAG TPA: 3-hydroxyacyl-CoA dehydrogenase NAD-binding domain-containing protein [Steroidobacteraceae bacterium]|jgi:3-hydroxyacyl-CoA dehydrogenase|nr:3-hydroxyacyl-CoA dehydrogenase NAD-binding domain-containing protein [Steroidobacteraceae bacterium]